MRVAQPPTSVPPTHGIRQLCARGTCGVAAPETRHVMAAGRCALGISTLLSPLSMHSNEALVTSIEGGSHEQ